MAPKTEVAVFGGGCFWCTEAVFSKLKGVISVTSGYAGGKAENPTYEQVAYEDTGHAEVVKLEFDPSIITYDQLLEVFWAVHDPTSLNKQGADTGTEYRSIILCTTEEQKKLAEESMKKEEASGNYNKNIVTEIKQLDKFYTAEEHHQKFYEKNSDGMYCQIVINPKLQKLQMKFRDLLKD
jgi:peptide-methionine (S)-S-oxide reductase